MSMNKVFLLGRLGADPELRYTASQLPICTMRLATNEPPRKGPDGESVEHTEWHSVVAFGKTAENCSNYLQKGRQAFIEGRIQTRKYQDKEGKDRYMTEIIANNVQFIGGGRSEGMDIERSNAPRAEKSYGAPAASAPSVANAASIGETISFDDDDIPF